MPQILLNKLFNYTEENSTKLLKKPTSVCEVKYLVNVLIFACKFMGAFEVLVCFLFKTMSKLSGTNGIGPEIVCLWLIVD